MLERIVNQNPRPKFSFKYVVNLIMLTSKVFFKSIIGQDTSKSSLVMNVLNHYCSQRPYDSGNFDKILQARA